MIARWTILCMAAAGALLGGPVAATYQPDVMIRGQGETFWRGEGIYLTTRLNQSKVRSVRSGTTAVYELRIRNDGTSTDSFLVAGTAGDASWTIRYYDSLEGGNNITTTVTNSGWLTRTIGPTGWESVRVEVTPGPDAVAGSEKQVRVFAISHGDCTKSDIVKANTFLTAGNVYYCSPTGSDSNPGDTLVILGGKYVIRRFDDDIMDPPSGTAQAHTIIRGEEGNRPVIAGRDTTWARISGDGARPCRTGQTCRTSRTGILSRLRRGELAEGVCDGEHQQHEFQCSTSAYIATYMVRLPARVMQASADTICRVCTEENWFLCGKVMLEVINALQGQFLEWFKSHSWAEPYWRY